MVSREDVMDCHCVCTSANESVDVHYLKWMSTLADKPLPFNTCMVVVWPARNMMCSPSGECLYPLCRLLASHPIPYVALCVVTQCVQSRGLPEVSLVLLRGLVPPKATDAEPPVSGVLTGAMDVQLLVVPFLDLQEQVRQAGWLGHHTLLGQLPKGPHHVGNLRGG